MADVLYFNGRFTTTDEPVIGVEDRGFQFGDSVYEVIKFLRKTPLFAIHHYRRLVNGLDAIDIRCPWERHEFEELLRELLKRTAFDDGTIYIQVTRGNAPRAHFYPENIQPTALAYTRRFTFPDADRKEKGIRVITTPDIRWKHCDVKSVNLLGNVLAKKKAQRAGADEALFILDGNVSEGASSSFFAVEGGRIVTHPFDPEILPGTIRDVVISLALAEHIRVDERAIHEHELFSLDEAFITSTTQGVMPVTELDGRIIGNGRRGEITERLQQLFDAYEQRSLTGANRGS